MSSAVAIASAAAVVATMFIAPAQRASVNAAPRVPTISPFAGAQPQHYVVSRLLRLEDGVFMASAEDTHVSFQPV